MKGKDRLGQLGVYGTITLKHIFDKQDVKVSDGKNVPWWISSHVMHSWYNKLKKLTN
jgi:hypothetical protein